MNKKEYDFLKEYEKVCQKYKMFIGSCGCCSSPYLDGEDCEKASKAGISNSQLYKQAGNSIVVDVLMAIFKELLWDTD